MRPYFRHFGLAIAALLLSQFGLVLALPLPPASNILAQAQTAQDLKAQAEQLNENGRRQLDRGQLREAFQTFEQALVIYRELGDRPGIGETLNNLGRST